MRSMDDGGEPKKGNWLLASGLGAAFLGSLCCIGPAVFIAFGLGSFATGAFFETIRPWMGGLALIALVFAWRHTLRRKACCKGACEVPEKRNKGQIVLLSIVTPLALGILAYPSISEAILESRNADAMEIPEDSTLLTVSIPSMDCASCAVGIQSKMSEQEGIENAHITYETKIARITYDPKQVTEKEILQAIESTGFPTEALKTN